MLTPAKVLKKYLRTVVLTIGFCVVFFSVFCAGQGRHSPLKNNPKKILKNTDQSGNRVLNEYIVTVKKGAGKAEIQKAFEWYGISKISVISPDLYLIHLVKDPGLEEMNQVASHAAGIKAIQPNYRYRVNSAF